ncbi:hypothetical protein [Lysobacter gummosus]|uniref:hypothetical protein n=1 Tax=Lysobacter gummosus TaxID=262324 RepID=UPI00362C88A8
MRNAYICESRAPTGRSPLAAQASSACFCASAMRPACRNISDARNRVSHLERELSGWAAARSSMKAMPSAIAESVNWPQPCSLLTRASSRNCGTSAMLRLGRASASARCRSEGATGFRLMQSSVTQLSRLITRLRGFLLVSRSAKAS